MSSGKTKYFWLVSNNGKWSSVTCCARVNFHFPWWNKTSDGDGGWRFICKPLFKYSGLLDIFWLRRLLILITFLWGAYGTTWPVDIYKPVWMWEMNPIRRNTHVPLQGPVSTAWHHISTWYCSNKDISTLTTENQIIMGFLFSSVSMASFECFGW